MRERPLTAFLSSEKAAEKKTEKPSKKVGVKGPWKLPEGWRWVRLGEIAEIIMGQSPPSDSYNTEGVGLPFYQGSKDFGIIHPTPRVWCINPKKIAEKGDILISVRAPVGPVNIATEKCVIGRGLAAIRPLKIERMFLFYFLKSYENKWSGFGSTFNAIRKKELQNLHIPLPPLEEQKHIVAKLDEVSKRLEEAKHLAREAREEAERLMASALHEVFSKAEEKGWEWKKIEKVSGIRGNAGVKKKLSQFDSIAFIPMKLIPENGVFARYELREPANIKSYSYSEPGDILLAKITPSFENGKQGIVPENIPNGFALATTEVYPIYIKDTNSLDRMYLFYILRSKYAREILEDQMLGTTGRQRVPKEAVLKLKIPLPPLEEQQRIVAYLDFISERAQRLVQLYEEQEKELEQLFPAILDRAFRGEL